MEEKTIKKCGGKVPSKPKPAKNCENKKSVGGGKPKRKLNINVGSFPQPKLTIYGKSSDSIKLPRYFSTDSIDYSKLSRKEKEELLIKTEKELRESEKEIEENLNSNL